MSASPFSNHPQRPRMPIALDHVFICCEAGAPEAQALLDVGLVEGTGNVHPGQGTANRRFFFDGGFIELLWVHHPLEAQSALTAPTRLWPRWQASTGLRTPEACPFGLAFGPTGAEVLEPPFTTWPYRPSYLPAGKEIQFAQGTPLHEPELFYLAWAHTQASSQAQPKAHPNGLLRLCGASVGLPAHHLDTGLSAAAAAAQAAGLVRFHAAERFELRLSFEGRVAVEFDLRPALPLVLSTGRLTAP